MKSQWLATAVLLAAALSGCSGPTTAVPAVGIPTSPPAPSPPPQITDPDESTDAPRVDEIPRRETSEPVDCSDAEDVAVSFSPVDAGLGNRWLVLTVRNCSGDPITLPGDPLFEAVNDDGSIYPSSWRWDEPQGSLVLAPGSDKFVVAHWLSNGRCERGVQELRIHLLGETFSEQDCFQFGGDTAPDREGDDGDLYWADDPGQPPG
ncbi:MAG: DUF4232 domain-containing protein [Arachnia sp.]